MKAKNQNFLNESEEQFFGADGGDNEFFSVGGEKYGADGGEAVAVEQPDFQRTFTLQLYNPEAFAQTCTLFNAQQTLVSPTFGLPATVVFTSLESNIATVYSSTMFSPLQIAGFRLEADPAVTNYASQLRQVLTVNKLDMYGVAGTYRIAANSYIDLKQQIDYAVDIKPYRIDVTAQSSIAFSLLAGQTVTFTFYTGSQIHQSHGLHGRPALSQVTAPLPMTQSQTLTLSKNTVAALMGNA